ncbi:MAG: insulinase family protein [Lunatimonas sp.]|uniref:M16 family metallopeptidase n=1 Tax=Lunatimonas sp. TaxID=2060141 RepID=UPI00263AE299|nr:pitrilysin family protein [Lunatimonas sp.]MCC5937243.1 insulinase family protein [Lunatimonas sp.]
MKKLLLIILSVVLVQVAGAQIDRSTYPEPGPAPEIKLGDVASFTLPNGLKVFVVENRKLPRIAFSLVLDRDPLLQGEKAGMLDLYGDMMMGGTASRSKDELDEEVDFIGASLSATSTSLFASALTKNRDKIVELMTDVLYNPIFPENELDKLKKQAISGLAASKDDPNSISGRLTAALNYGKDHPYGETYSEATINHITTQDIKQYYATYFKPNISYLAIVGDISSEEAETLVREHFSKWEKGEVPSHRYAMPTVPPASKVALVDRSSSVQTVVNITYPLEMRLSHPDFFVTRLMNYVLGGGASSRLFMNLREDKGYTYGAYSSIGSDKLVTSFSARASVKQTATDSAIHEMIYEIRNLAENGVTEDELQAAKANLGGSFGRSLESPSTIASFAINTERYGLPDDFYATYLQQLNAVTVEDVNKAARKYLMPDNLYITAVGNGREIGEKLQVFGDLTRYTNMGDVEKEIDLGEEALDASGILQAYLQAIGGASAAEGIKTVKMELATEIQGNQITMITVQDTPNEIMVQKVLMGGTEVSKTVMKDGKATVSAMGQSQTLPDEQFEYLKMSMWSVPELFYETMGYTLTVDGVTEVEGEAAYKLIVANPTGGELINYYSVATGLKLRSDDSLSGETTYKSYEAFEGVLLPVSLSVQSPMIPVPLEFEVKELEVNGSISDQDLK